MEKGHKAFNGRSVIVSCGLFYSADSLRPLLCSISFTSVKGESENENVIHVYKE